MFQHSLQAAKPVIHCLKTILLHTACMHHRTVRSVTCIHVVNVLQQNAHAIALWTACTLLLSDIDPALILFPPSNCTCILSSTEINYTRGNTLRKYGRYSWTGSYSAFSSLCFERRPACYFAIAQYVFWTSLITTFTHAVVLDCWSSQSSRLNQ